MMVVNKLLNLFEIYTVFIKTGGSQFLTLKLMMACYSLIEEVYKNPLNSGKDLERNFGLNDGQNWKTCYRSGNGGWGDFASLWPVLIFPFFNSIAWVAAGPRIRKYSSIQKVESVCDAGNN